MRVNEETAAALNATRQPRRNRNSSAPSPAPSGHRRRHLLQRAAAAAAADEYDGMSSDPEPQSDDQLEAALESDSDDEYGSEYDTDDQDGDEDEDGEDAEGTADMQAVEDAAAELDTHRRRELRSADAIARRQSPSGFKCVVDACVCVDDADGVYGVE